MEGLGSWFVSLRRSALDTMVDWCRGVELTGRFRQVTSVVFEVEYEDTFKIPSKKIEF